MAKGGSKKFKKMLGHRVFALVRKGANPPADVLRAADRFKNDSGTEADIRTVTKWLGIDTRRAAQTKQLRRELAFVSSVAQDAAILSQVQGGSAAALAIQGRLIDTFTRELSDFVKGKGAQEFTENLLAKLPGRLRQDPVVATRLLSGISAGLRLGGAAVAVATAGVQVTQSYFENRQRTATARGAALDAGRRSGIDYEELRSIIREEQAAAYQEGSTFEKFGNIFGLTGATEERASKRAQARIATRAAARAVTGEAGLNAAALLGIYAKGKGKSIGELTERERAEAIDAATESYGGREAFRDDPRVDRILSREFGNPDEGWLDYQLLNLPSTLAGLVGFEGTQSKIDRRRAEIEIELAAGEVQRLAQLREDRNYVGRQARENRSAAENFILREDMLESEANFRATRMRRAGPALD